MRDIFRAVISSFIKSFKDTFNRANSSTLGTSSSGIPWTLYRNTFQILNNKARADSSDYSLAAVQTGSSDVEIGLKGISQGAGSSLWVTDSGNWWSVSIAQEPTDCNCTTFYNTFTFNSAFNFSNTVFVQGNTQTTCTGWTTNFCQNSFNFNSYNPVVAYFCCFGWNAAGFCKGNFFCGNTGGTGQFSFATYPNTFACGSTCTSSFTFNNSFSYTVTGTAWNTETGTSGPFQSCQTCYPQYIKIFKSVNNVISAVFSQTIASIAQSLRITTSGNEITVRSYSDTELVSQIGNDIVYTATGAVITPRFGISVNPSAYDQGFDIDEISID